MLNLHNEDRIPCWISVKKFHYVLNLHNEGRIPCWISVMQFSLSVDLSQWKSISALTPHARNVIPLILPFSSDFQTLLRKMFKIRRMTSQGTLHKVPRGLNQRRMRSPLYSIIAETSNICINNRNTCCKAEDALGQFF